MGEPSLGLGDAELLERLAEAEWVGIDAPFGWPEAMVDAVHAYATTGQWPAPSKPEFRYLLTDRFAHDHVLTETEQKLWPLSPSTDRIALTAWRLAGLREAAWKREALAPLSARLREGRAAGERAADLVPGTEEMIAAALAQRVGRCLLDGDRLADLQGELVEFALTPLHGVGGRARSCDRRLQLTRHSRRFVSAATRQRPFPGVRRRPPASPRLRLASGPPRRAFLR